MRNFRVYACTWNVATLDPPSPELLRELLHCQEEEEGEEKEPDLYALGFQEVSAKPHHFVRDVVVDDPYTDCICKQLSPKGYIKIRDIRLQGLLLLVFVKLQHVPFLRNIQTNYTRTGLGGLWGNKGAVTVRFGLYGYSVCLVNCHLEAHLEGWKLRDRDYSTIIRDQVFENCRAKTILNHDYVIWLGDLNYRISDISIEDVKDVLNRNELHILKFKDQLFLSQEACDAFHDFSEGDLNFPPTYKLNPGTNEYNVSGKQRKPAWCDRILWKVNKDRIRHVDLNMELVTYNSIQKVQWSDHLPVYADFILGLKSTDTKPLIKFHSVKDWKQYQENECIYMVDIDTSTSAWDWIALYKVGFRHPKDYITYVWAIKDGENMEHGCHVVFEPVYLPTDLTSRYMLGYYSSLSDNLLGLSKPFQIFPASPTRNMDLMT
ncbi:phosphatidylinositol 4,5-bisphosphate 5-phosphatase A-like [Saccoglossus kowalevskii]|uniref:Phosphatidylinositol 4,5-bisphosphate 5-phosphatase A-like n=1 Tax=Saccoglossus kowalevskii TaxID=10224 RepID=A0ABM0M6U5_SACKO|nr:PREDICTED: phosphatidylinositol 4,5-bisphosphate 5-phosphatase A-like [Saccoglossus kowalevskii]